MKRKRKERPGEAPAVKETMERLRRFAQEEQARVKKGVHSIDTPGGET